MNKICTSQEQSKKLIELGIDISTADMYWWSTSKRSYIEAMDDGDFNEMEGHIRAWSLTALINVLPRVDIEKEMWSDDTYDYRVKAYIDDGYIGDWFDNPIDACYNMIIELHKDKLL